MADSEAVEQEEQQADATGHDSAEGKTEQREERDPPAGEEAESAGQDAESDEAAKAKKAEEQREGAKEKIKELEDGEPPGDLEEWPDDAAKYETFGGPEGQHSYEDGPERKLGPSSLRHHEDGKVSIEGEEVDNPDEYKGEPIPGGPTDPNASQDLTTEKIRERQGRELESEKGGDDSESDSDSDSESDSDSD